MKKRYMFLASVLSLALLIAPALASEDMSSSSTGAEVSRFADYISCFFEHPNEWHALDADGNDISQEYWTNNISLYQQGRFAELMAQTTGVVDSLYYFDAACEHSSLGIVPYASRSRQTYQNFICVVDGNWGGFLPPASEVYVRLEGNYEVEIDNNVITKVSSSSPTVSITGFGDIVGPSPIYTTSNIRSTATFTNQRATFTATFDIYITYGSYDTRTYCGTYTISIVGDVNGGEAIDYSPNDGTGNRYVYPQ